MTGSAAWVTAMRPKVEVARSRSHSLVARISRPFRSTSTSPRGSVALGDGLCTFTVCAPRTGFPRAEGPPGKGPTALPAIPRLLHPRHVDVERGPSDDRV